MAVWSTVDFSEVKKPIRFDAEYWKPEYVAFERQARLSGGPLTDYIDQIIQPAEFIREYVAEGEGASFWRTQNVRPGYIDRSDVARISWDIYEGVESAHVQEGDVLIVRTGANAGDCAVVPAGTEATAVSSHTLRLVPESVEMGYAIGAFFASELGRRILLRTTSGSSRPQITKTALQNLSLPDFSDLAGPITSQLREAERTRAKSKVVYQEAEELLMQQLDLDLPNLSHRVCYTAAFSEVMGAERFDSNYFHPEKTRALQALEEMPGRSVQSYFGFIDDRVEPATANSTKEVYNYDLTHALHYFLDDNVAPTLAGSLGSAKVSFQRGDVVVSRLRSYLQEIALVATPDEKSCVGSSEFYVFRPRGDVHSELLLVYLRCPLVQRILKWCQKGSAHPRFRQEELLHLNVPDRIIEVQDEIKQLVQAGVQAHRKARNLLKEAQNNVETFVRETA